MTSTKTDLPGLLPALFFLFIITLFYNSCVSPESHEGDYVEKTAQLCECDLEWFPHAQTPPPEEGKGSPFDTSSTTNCIFHQWSWQKFLWLTKPQDNGLPLFLNETIQVSDAMEALSMVQGSSILLIYTEQAGSNGILVSNPSYNTDNIAETIYYSIHVNDTMMVAANSFLGRMKNGDLPLNNLESFPVSSLELKISWISTAAIPSDKIDSFFTTQAAVVSTSGQDTSIQTMALLGMHVVGVVINHPEFIWATFEHSELAPDMSWSDTTAVSNDELLLFKKGSMNNLNGIQAEGNPGYPKTLYQAYDLFQYGVPRIPGNGFMATSQDEPENFDNISEIDSCVNSHLGDVWNNYYYNGSIWINTDGLSPEEQAETIVNKGQHLGSALPDSIARGSLNNANVTMETYTQTFQNSFADIHANNIFNCLGCHNGQTSFTKKDKVKSPLYISHIFDAFVKSNNGMSREEINQIKDREHLETIGRYIQKNRE